MPTPGRELKHLNEAGNPNFDGFVTQTYELNCCIRLPLAQSLLYSVATHFVGYSVKYVDSEICFYIR